ncbi:MAG: tRNA (adenosine(37)-N6)-threonylcarbamoyltransferase complex ATPase subunit type 1 TsaE [Deltaproteobacteria bacterium]|nr:tRNA (adenosine(37)-N6)-threonylcarbamoyltransferase complex ATPase subunit type 1 TsaE [Deltaproteobacteria bacterium]
MEEVFITESAEETIELGEKLSKGELGIEIAKGSVIALNGELGGGKTHFTKGIALGLGYTGYVKSPSFTILHEYTGGTLPLYHIDLYRIESGVEELGLEEYIEGEGVTVIEWAERATELFDDKTVMINFEYIDEDKRRIIIKK